MDQQQLRARGVSPTLRGIIANPLRRLLWPFQAPYFAALLEELSELRSAAAAASAASAAAAAGRAGDGIANCEHSREAKADTLRHYDALKKDLAAIAHRLASFEERAASTEAKAEAATISSVPTRVEPARPSYAQCGEDRIVDYLLRICGAPTTIRYLDIGAAFPSGDSNTFLFYQRGGSGVLVEADPGYLPAYRSVRPRDVAESAAIVPAAMMPASGTIQLLLGENPGWTTIMPEQAAEAARRGKGGVRQRLPVPATTIGAVLDRHFADGVLHLISIDAEGIDDAIMRDIDFTRHRPWVLVIETMGADGPADFLAGQGYTAYADTHVNRIFVRQEVLARATF